MSNTVSQSIFNPTLFCPSVAEYQSKVNSSGIPANTLFKAVSVNQGPAQTQNFLLSTKFRGNKLYVRKRKLAMGRLGRFAGIPHAVLTTDPASEVNSKLWKYIGRGLFFEYLISFRLEISISIGNYEYNSVYVARCPAKIICSVG